MCFQINALIMMVQTNNSKIHLYSHFSNNAYICAFNFFNNGRFSYFLKRLRRRVHETDIGLVVFVRRTKLQIPRHYLFEVRWNKSKMFIVIKIRQQAKHKYGKSFIYNKSDRELIKNITLRYFLKFCTNHSLNLSRKNCAIFILKL